MQKKKGNFPLFLCKKSSNIRRFWVLWTIYFNRELALPFFGELQNWRKRYEILLAKGAFGCECVDVLLLSGTPQRKCDLPVTDTVSSPSPKVGQKCIKRRKLPFCCLNSTNYLFFLSNLFFLK